MVELVENAAKVGKMEVGAMEVGTVVNMVAKLEAETTAVVVRVV
jgi:hypothetical protein